MATTRACIGSVPHQWRDQPAPLDRREGKEAEEIGEYSPLEWQNQWLRAGAGGQIHRDWPIGEMRRTLDQE